MVREPPRYTSSRQLPDMPLAKIARPAWTFDATNNGRHTGEILAVKRVVSLRGMQKGDFPQSVIASNVLDF